MQRPSLRRNFAIELAQSISASESDGHSANLRFKRFASAEHSLLRLASLICNKSSSFQKRDPYLYRCQWSFLNGTAQHFYGCLVTDGTNSMPDFIHQSIRVCTAHETINVPCHVTSVLPQSLPQSELIREKSFITKITRCRATCAVQIENTANIMNASA